MDRVEALDRIVARHALNNHPFYQEWAAGTLPVEKLRYYAADFGHFLKFIALGWDKIGYEGVAEEERQHEVLWGDFQDAIESGSELCNPETRDLIAASQQALGSRASALGALYAYETQQPVTAASKLAGLNKFYDVPEHGKRYFVIHADDVAEVEMLCAEVEKLTEGEFLVAEASCRRISEQLWRALDGFMAPALA